MKQMGCDTKDAVSLQQHKLLWKARAALVLPGPVTAGTSPARPPPSICEYCPLVLTRAVDEQCRILETC